MKSSSLLCDGSPGAVATDFDGDGRLELLVSHGESAAQPLSVYKVNQGSTNSWLRVIPRTKFGAFARGAKVVVYTKKTGPHTRIIDGGSGYLCEMEPVAHFGLGKDVATNVEVYWPDGRSVARPLEPSEINSVLEIHYPRDEEEFTPTVEIECGHGFALNENGRCTDKDECTQFPSVCPSDRPVCTNTYGSYKCRAKRRCNQGFEPNDDGSACVARLGDFAHQGFHSPSSGSHVVYARTSCSIKTWMQFSVAPEAKQLRAQSNSKGLISELLHRPLFTTNESADRHSDSDPPENNQALTSSLITAKVLSVLLSKAGREFLFMRAPNRLSEDKSHSATSGHFSGLTTEDLIILLSTEMSSSETEAREWKMFGQPERHTTESCVRNSPEPPRSSHRKNRWRRRARRSCTTAFLNPALLGKKEKKKEGLRDASRAEDDGAVRSCCAGLRGCAQEPGQGERARERTRVARARK
ncbi:hypothetical protein F2P81_020215 [Scophthalmus maximus]|uniref:EGF-like calcium-binding domain-containing protein n=1 Tax=Scophthalmus maximus TaxID=52904 RepID=A0A6A4S9W0_SCOMX|nr:hypothetical protein F2P81_020215 [Scophthalmus maximus]